MIMSNIHVHPKIKEAYEYWRNVSSDSCLPKSRQFNFTKYSTLSPNISVIEVRRNPLKFWNRYVGGEIEEFAGEHLADKPFAQRLTGRWRYRAEMGIRTVINSGLPNWRRGKPLIRWEERNVELERMLFPMSEDGKTVDAILAVSMHSKIPAGEFSGIFFQTCDLFPSDASTCGAAEKFDEPANKDSVAGNIGIQTNVSRASRREIQRHARRVHLELINQFITATKDAKDETQFGFLSESLDDQIQHLTRLKTSYLN